MKEYQERYIRNLESVMELADLSGELPDDLDVFLENRRQNLKRIGEIAEENTELLRQNLMPVLDDIISVSPVEAKQLVSFTQKLSAGVRQLDLVLNYTIHNALVTYARKWQKRDMLIEQLYYTGMALFYMQSLIDQTGLKRYRWKMSTMFGEAASYIRHYDEIEDPQIRGYIHRSMANLALAYTWDGEDAPQKLNAIRRSMNVLTDPVYHEMTPSLPWDLFLLKSHQERTTAMTLLRRGWNDPGLVSDVMESAVFVWEKQLEQAKKKGRRPSVRWWLEYEMAQYHCGVYTLSVFLTHIEEMYMGLEEQDFSEDGIFGNVNLPAYYTLYLERDREILRKKRQVVQYMYHRIMRYAKNAPNSRLNSSLFRSLMSVLQAFQEYPAGITQKEFLCQIIICRNPDLYVFLKLTATLSCMVARRALRDCPEVFVGLPGFRDEQEVRKKEQKILQFVYEGGELHDIGTFSFLNLVTLSGRSWLEEEKVMYESHTTLGEKILARCESTRPYAPIALGHHRSYDGKDGYPQAGSQRTSDLTQTATDIVAVVSRFLTLLEDNPYRGMRRMTFSEAFERIGQEAGKGLSPVFADLLLSMRDEVMAVLPEERNRSYAQALRLLKGQEE